MQHCTATAAGYGGAAVRAGCLPNTGLNLTYVVIVAVALIVIGVYFRLKGFDASQ